MIAETPTIHDMGTETRGERIRQARRERGLTQQQLADRVGLHQTLISKLEEGKVADSTAILDIARALDVSPDWLSRGIGPKQRGTSAIEIPIGSSDYPEIRRVELKVTAGISGFAIEPIEDDSTPIAFRSEWFARRGLDPKHLLAISVEGSSMEPTLYDGDTVIINTADTKPHDEGVYAINYEGEVILKRLFRLGSTWVATADNLDKQRHPNRPMHEGAFVIGRVVHKQSERL